MAYLTKEKEFFNLKLIINKNVLIPRPETETLVETVLKKINNSKSRLKILDIGTGSGNIIISLAKALKRTDIARSETTRQSKKKIASSAFDGPTEATNFEFFASDISKRALVVAKRNAKFHKVKIKFKQGSLLVPWKKERFDVIMANLPYGWRAWKNNICAETIGLKFEPQSALYTKKQGLELIEKLFQQISHLREVRSDDRATKQSLPKYIILEFDPRQKNQIKKLAEKYLPAYECKIIFDLSYQARFLSLSLP
jgi:release factor glutamine methyltransferase